MKLITFREFILAVLFSIVFAWVFIYVIPAITVDKFGPTQEEVRDSFRANAYSNYLARKGYTND